jgi:hypothetical protein
VPSVAVFVCCLSGQVTPGLAFFFPLETTFYRGATSKELKSGQETNQERGNDMAAGTLNLNAPRSLLYDAILDEIRSWADFPRRIFVQAHYGGRSVQEIAAQTGYATRDVSRILETHERKLRKSLRPFRMA